MRSRQRQEAVVAALCSVWTAHCEGKMSHRGGTQVRCLLACTGVVSLHLGVLHAPGSCDFCGWHVADMVRCYGAQGARVTTPPNRDP